jgi:PTS system ascorbate-specific IIB component
MAKKALKIIAACGNGSGTSLMAAMAIEKACRELDIPLAAPVHHCGLAEATSSINMYDIAFTPLNFVDNFKNAKHTMIIGLRNVMSAAEVKEKLSQTDFAKDE